MAIELVPIPLPASADVSKLANFGREVRGVNPADLTPGSELFKEIESALYTVCLEMIDLPSMLDNMDCSIVRFCSEMSN